MGPPLSARQVIINQMRERERERVRQLELQDQEREAMLRQNEEIKQVRAKCWLWFGIVTSALLCNTPQEEFRQMVAKKEAGKKLLEQVAASNAEQVSTEADCLVYGFAHRVAIKR